MTMTNGQMVLFLLLDAFISCVVNVVDGFTVAQTVEGMAALLGIIFVGVALWKIIPWKGFPAVAYITTLGCIVTIPDFLPMSGYLSAVTKNINFIGLCTPILAYAGLALGKDIDLLKKQGLKIVLVGLMVFVGTFVGSAFIAEIILRQIR
ncbi:MAG: DUF340 domain-containing protein [Pyramidobacter sp.]|jgi:hypothetical protein